MSLLAKEISMNKIEIIGWALVLAGLAGGLVLEVVNHRRQTRKKSLIEKLRESGSI